MVIIKLSSYVRRTRAVMRAEVTGEKESNRRLKLNEGKTIKDEYIESQTLHLLMTNFINVLAQSTHY